MSDDLWTQEANELLRAGESLFLTSKQSQFSAEAYCFDKQLALINDPSYFATAVCSVRAGKTIACAVDLLQTARRIPGCNVLYLTLSRVNAKRIIWPELVRINREFQLGGKVNETELYIKLSNDSVVYVSGAKDKTEIEKFRGIALALCYIDECFSGDTLVDTPSGKKRISDIRKGDKVLNAWGVDTVTKVSKKKVAKSKSLEFNNGKVICSDRHPFFTARGWVFAKDLRPGDLLARQSFSMRILRDALQSKALEALSFLQCELLREVRKAALAQPDEKRRGEAQGFEFAKGDGMEAGISNGQWDGADRARENHIERVSAIEMEPCDFSWKAKAEGVSDQLQGGPCGRAEQASDRSGRPESQPSDEKGAGPKEGIEAGYFRLESIEDYKQPGDAKAAEEFFYDLTVLNHPSFSVNGALVHNCQLFRDYIRELVDEVIAKRLFDYAGRLRLIGTPGPVPVGYFYDCARSDQWSHHHWTMFDNPWLPKKSGQTHQQILQRELERKGVSVDDPAIQRECFGVWSKDDNALVFRYNEGINDYEAIPEETNWTYVVGVDLGYEDADAIAVIGWHQNAQVAWLVEESIKTKQGITDLAKEIERVVHTYNPDRIVMDTGGLGKKIAEEIQRRYGLPIIAAEKVRKFEFIELLNDAMRTKRFYAKKNSRFAQDCMLVQWDRDAPYGVPRILDSYHSDICDAVLYAFREAYHWLWEAPPPAVHPNTPEWFAREVKQMEEAALKRFEDTREETDPWEKGFG